MNDLLEFIPHNSFFTLLFLIKLVIFCLDHLEEMKALHSESAFLKALIPEVIISTLGDKSLTTFQLNKLFRADSFYKNANILYDFCDFFTDICQFEITDVTEVGVRQAELMITQQTSNLQYCRHCLEVMHRSRNSAAPQTDTSTFLHAHTHTHVEDRNSDPLRAGDVPEDVERINSVAEHMKTYSFSDKVQIVGLDAIIVYARSGESSALAKRPNEHFAYF